MTETTPEGERLFRNRHPELDRMVSGVAYDIADVDPICVSLGGTYCSGCAYGPPGRIDLVVIKHLTPSGRVTRYYCPEHQRPLIGTFTRQHHLAVDTRAAAAKAADLSVHPSDDVCPVCFTIRTATGACAC